MRRTDTKLYFIFTHRVVVIYFDADAYQRDKDMKLATAGAVGGVETSKIVPRILDVELTTHEPQLVCETCDLTFRHSAIWIPVHNV